MDSAKGARGEWWQKDSNGAATALASGRAHAHVRTYVYVHTFRIHAYKRDCIYAESYLPRLKSHRGESRGRSALGIASARVVIPPRCASHPSALLSLRFAAHPRGSLPTMVHPYADASLAFLRKDVAPAGFYFIFLVFPASHTPCRAGKRWFNPSRPGCYMWGVDNATSVNQRQVPKVSKFCQYRSIAVDYTLNFWEFTEER